MENIIFTVNTVLPVFLIIVLGMVLKWKNFIADDFVKTSSKIVFKITLPALIFINISTSDFTKVINPTVIILLLSGTLAIFFLSMVITLFFRDQTKAKGSFVQGATRGNIAILGFAIIYNVFGDQGLSFGAIILSFILPLFNILSVIALTVFIHGNSKGSIKKILFNIISNPLIIAVLIALPFSIFQIKIIPLVSSSITYLSQMTLPLALIGVGASLSFKSLYDNAIISIIASIIKIVITPLLITITGYLLGLRGMHLGVVMIISASPTAIASFIMATAMENDSHVAANIIVLTTLGSILSIGIGIFLLKSLGLF